jgi:hypothetical protein
MARHPPHPALGCSFRATGHHKPLQNGQRRQSVTNGLSTLLVELPEGVKGVVSRILFKLANLLKFTNPTKLDQ